MTYLPDGDIDIGAMLPASQVRTPHSHKISHPAQTQTKQHNNTHMRLQVPSFFQKMTKRLQAEARNPYAKYVVRDVNFIDAEVFVWLFVFAFPWVVCVCMVCVCSLLVCWACVLLCWCECVRRTTQTYRTTRSRL